MLNENVASLIDTPALSLCICNACFISFFCLNVKVAKITKKSTVRSFIRVKVMCGFDTWYEEFVINTYHNIGMNFVLLMQNVTTLVVTMMEM